MNKEYLKEILSNQRKQFLNKNKGVTREILTVVEQKLKLPHIMVITGIRRCGKSTLLRQIVSYFLNNTDFYYINFEDERLLNFKAEEFNAIYETLIELYGQKKTFLIDEIQNAEKFETFVRRFYDEGFRFIITGSNSNLLSRELGSRLTGRYINITLYPFSFKEFLNFKNIDVNTESIYITESRALIKKYFSIYLQQGGMPEYITYNDPEILYRTYEDIVLKDVVVRYNIDNVRMLRELYHYLIANFARPYSYNSLKKIIPFRSINSIKKYIHILQDTFLIRELSQFHHSIKKQLINNKKLYIVDNGFIQIISPRFTNDKGWLLENMVFAALNKKENLFYYSNKNECDFISITDNVLTTIQVCFDLTPQNTEREIAGLLEATKTLNAEKWLILTNDYENSIVQDNKIIEIIPVWKWLLY